MTPQVYIALIIAPVLAIAFLLLAGATPRNVAAVMVFEWLFLPNAGIKLTEGLPAYDKSVVVAISIVIGTLSSRAGAFARLRPKWIDLPMAIWCLVPIASSLDNGLGFYDGMAAACRQSIMYGAPYLAGRLVFVDAEAMIELARMLAIGGAVYFPFCLVESRMAPQFHQWVYGTGGRVNWETADFFGPLRYKPSVFLQANLELTPLMGAAALCGWWLWRAGRSRPVRQDAPSGRVAASAGMAAILGKSLGGFSLAVGGAGVLFLCQKYRRPLFMAAFLAVAPTYMVTRTAGVWSGAQVVQFLKDYVSERRAESFDTRLGNEDRLVEKAMERPVFGWAGWGRSRVYDENGTDITLTDGMWVIAFGSHGLVGLAGLYGALLLPVAVVIRRTGPTLWTDPRFAGMAAIAVIVVLHSIDCLANAMPNPVYYGAAGGLAAAGGLPRFMPRKGAVAPQQARRKRVKSVARPSAGRPGRTEVGRSIT